MVAFTLLGTNIQAAEEPDVMLYCLIVLNESLKIIALIGYHNIAFCTLSGSSSVLAFLFKRVASSVYFISC